MHAAEIGAKMKKLEAARGFWLIIIEESSKIDEDFVFESRKRLSHAIFSSMVKSRVRLLNQIKPFEKSILDKF